MTYIQFIKYDEMQLLSFIYIIVFTLPSQGCFKLQFDLCELMIKIWKQENLPLEKIFCFLFTSGRLSHAYCHLPLDKEFISKAAEHLGVDCHHTDFWRNCFEGERPSLFMFLQRMLLSDLFFPESCEQYLRSDVSVDEVNKAALSLVSEVSSVSYITSN
jgi:separase